MSLVNDFIDGKIQAAVQSVDDQYRFITYLRDIIPERVSNWDNQLRRYEVSPNSAGFRGFIHMGMIRGDNFVYQYKDGQIYQEEKVFLSDILREIYGDDGKGQIEVDDSICFF